jgi:hypothetical protein
MSNNIVDLFNSNSKNFIITQSWMIENKDLTNFETRKFSVPVLTSEMKNEYLNIDMGAYLINAIKSEISQDVNKLFNKKLFTTNKFDYLDLRHDDSLMTGRKNLEKLVSLILSNDYKNLITTGLISSELQDSPAFSPYMITDDLKTGAEPQSYGRLGGHLEVYNDPYMKYDDGRICLFNGVEFNIGEMKAYESTPSSLLGSRIVIEYNIDYNVGDSKLIFVIENENSEAFKQYKWLQRDIKIDNILDGNSL